MPQMKLVIQLLGPSSIYFLFLNVVVTGFLKTRLLNNVRTFLSGLTHRTQLDQSNSSSVFQNDVL
jgi:hypothetical protein